MRKILIVLFSICLLQSSKAQLNYPLSAGPFLSAKAGYNTSYSPWERKNLFAFNGLPDFGFSFYIPASDEFKLGLLADLSLSTYAYQVKGMSSDTKFTLKYSYFTLCPGFHYSGIYAGLNLGLPVFADYGVKLETSKLNILAEVRLGGIIPIIEDETGRVNILFHCGYMLTGIYKDFVKDDPLLHHFPPDSSQNFTNEFNPHTISFSLGLNYMFNFR
ncbi:MAG: hypothetical protein A2X61_07215 [Ignavibacteria bacterium GWB2_35_12]|nr:MAG: hypothetical protein A2X63_14020 [Ignavibacteria bacterium GWA2_35_8]OGU39268.1 MAG: hypothetical protein A2X61_07215 [Ignavibacteria bacterium GWB2_35_12]OGU89464.1 MAG: hypothetical protein A2220_10960 [Ignavibacteria bacterium RIFOXYA2_FULL_35_10]OGV21150.1 MAG: hypothetical protein A2475_01315 [Ignavibacteria bacterium RIFOXYC2_FULL_35_21]